LPGAQGRIWRNETHPGRIEFLWISMSLIRAPQNILRDRQGGRMTHRDNGRAGAHRGAVGEVFENIQPGGRIGGCLPPNAADAERKVNGHSGFRSLCEQRLERIISGNGTQNKLKTAFNTPVGKEKERKEKEEYDQRKCQQIGPND
jgi:hypothetical protein